MKLICKTSVVKEKRLGTLFFADSERVDKWKRNIRQAVADKYGVDNVSQVPDIARKISASEKKRMSSLSEEERREITRAARQAIPKGRTDASNMEIKVWDVLRSLEIPFEHNVPFGRYNNDIYIESLGLVIDVHGDYWHANPSLFKESDYIAVREKTAKKIWERDALKKEAIEAAGLRYEVIWESTIRDSSVSLKNVVEKIIKGADNEERKDNENRTS